MKYLIAAFLLLATSALAQQPPPPTPEVQALQGKLMQEINANLQCTTAAIGLQAENVRLKAELDALKEPKK